MVENNPTLLKSVLKALAGTVVGVGIATFAIRATGVSGAGVLEKLAVADPFKIALGALGGVVLTATQAVRWREILRGINPVRYWTVFQSKLVGYAANSILPARLGDLLRVEFVSVLTGIPRSKVLATGITDLWFDKIGWIITFGIAYAIAPMPDWILKAMLVMGTLILAIGTLLFILSRGKSEGVGILGRFREGLDQPRFGRLFLRQMFLSPLSWTWETLLITFVAGAFGIPINFSQAFVVLTAFNLSMVVPIPANAGAFEVAATYALTAFGVPADRAVAFSLIYHMMLLIPGVTMGALFFSAHSGRFEFRKILREFRALKGTKS